MHYLKFIILICVAFSQLSSTKKVINQTQKEINNSKNNTYIFRWWDIVEIKKESEFCSSKEFDNIRSLKITCKDKEIAKWLIKQKDENRIDFLSIIPAHTLFYNLKNFEHKKIEYLTVAWNDFSNRKKSIQKINYIFNLIPENCLGDKTVTFILFPTSRSTMDGSRINFKQKDESIFSQKFIENKIIYSNNKCISRKVLMDKNSNPIVYWVQFKIIKN